MKIAFGSLLFPAASDCLRLARPRTSFHENSCLKEKEIHEERPFPSQQSPRFSRNRRRRTLKALEIVAKERGVPRVFLLNMNFRETKFSD